MTFFTADDFEGMNNIPMDVPTLSAFIANHKLQREAKVVYTDNLVHWGSDKDYVASRDTHRALLVCIEEIERKPCEHSVNIDSGGTMLENEKHIFKCNKCHKDISLKWEWEVVE